ncbi:MAG TPA: hypothetical protein VEQ10_03935 [Vicinamibacteria bacterium]|nr:hypothetical protein [Vicinamibacteria bacterium]
MTLPGTVDLGAVVRANRLACSRWTFSVTAASMIVARSPSATDERIRSRRRSSLSRCSALAVNCTR